MSYVSALIVAAGKGTRMGMNTNKQYIKICDKPILAHTISLFQESDLINEIILVVPPTDIDYCKENIKDYFGFSKISAIVPGGSERQESVYNGLLNLNKKCEIVVIHDGARPFANETMLLESVQAATSYGAAIIAVPVKDTVKFADANLFVKETVKRDKLWSVQTPQVFKKDIIINSHEWAIKHKFIGTDDSILAEQIGISPKIITGSYSNIKITTKEDLLMAESIITSKK